MANRNDRSAQTGPSANASAAIEDRAQDNKMNDHDDREESQDEAQERREAAPIARPRVEGGFFDIYKRSQGGRVRWGTAFASALLILWAAEFTFSKLDAIEDAKLRQILRISIPAVILLGFGLATYYVLARVPRVVDFLIATEGEMKKVHWTSRKEVIGSTKVVIFVLLAMGVLLFVVDLFLMLFFAKIGVLQLGQDVLTLLFGGSK